jgi:hypothetical protein
MQHPVSKLSPEARDNLEMTLDRFNAEEVSKIFKFMGWTWADAEDGVPEPHEVRAFARELMAGAYLASVVTGHGVMSSGRLQAEYWDGGEFSIAFVPISVD